MKERREKGKRELQKKEKIRKWEKSENREKRRVWKQK